MAAPRPCILAAAEVLQLLAEAGNDVARLEGELLVATTRVAWLRKCVRRDVIAELVRQYGGDGEDPAPANADPAPVPMVVAAPAEVAAPPVVVAPPVVAAPAVAMPVVAVAKEKARKRGGEDVCVACYNIERKKSPWKAHMCAPPCKLDAPKRGKWAKGVGVAAVAGAAAPGAVGAGAAAGVVAVGAAAPEGADGGAGDAAAGAGADGGAGAAAAGAGADGEAGAAAAGAALGAAGAGADGVAPGGAGADGAAPEGA